MTKHGPSKEAVALRWQEAYNKNATESKAMCPARSLGLMMSMKSKLSLRSLRDVTDLTDSDLDCMIQILQVVTCDLMFIDFSLWNRNVGHGHSWYS